MIKLIAKNGATKITLKGDTDVVGREVAYSAVRMVEQLISADEVVGYAAGATIIDVLHKIVPELKENEAEEKCEG